MPLAQFHSLDQIPIRIATVDAPQLSHRTRAVDDF